VKKIRGLWIKDSYSQIIKAARESSSNRMFTLVEAFDTIKQPIQNKTTPIQILSIANVFENSKVLMARGH
jgi:hypothetical protein